MTNEEVMQLMTDMGLHEGGIENWLMDNAWYLVVNKAIEKERERLTDAAMKAAEKAVDVAVALEREACAKLFELTDLSGLKSDVWLQNYTATILDGYAKAIRARGQA